jgi:hypothetical protein
MNSCGKIEYDKENCFYEDSTTHDSYFLQFRLNGEVYNMGDCALIQAEDEMAVNPNRELIEMDFRREDSAIIFAYLERIKASPSKVLELKRNLEENGVLVTLSSVLTARHGDVRRHRSHARHAPRPLAAPPHLRDPVHLEAEERTVRRVQAILQVEVSRAFWFLICLFASLLFLVRFSLAGPRRRTMDSSRRCMASRYKLESIFV